MLEIYSRISVWSMTGMTSVCIGVDFRKASSFFTYADSFRSCVVRSKSQKLESTISDWNQYWMQIESRFFAPFTTPSSPPLAITLILLSCFSLRCAHTRCACTHHPLCFSIFHLFLIHFLSISIFRAGSAAEGRASLTGSIKKKVTYGVDRQRKALFGFVVLVRKNSSRFYDLVMHDGIQGMFSLYDGQDIRVLFARGWKKEEIISF